MTKKTKTWAEKFERACQDTPKVVKLEGKMEKSWGPGTCVIPSPQEVETLMRKVPKGKVTTITDMRNYLAHKHKTTVACPFTTGIFSWITAYRAEEERAQGKTNIPPYWRTLKGDGEVNPKYPGGVSTQKMFLEAEGHTVITKGKKTKVADFENALAKLK